MPIPLDSFNFSPLTGVRATALDAAEAGDVAAGVLPVCGDNDPHACQLLALAACIPLARLAGYLDMDAAVRCCNPDADGAAVVADTAPDDAGCDMPIPLGVLRECRNVLTYARRVLGVPPPSENV